MKWTGASVLTGDELTVMTRIPAELPVAPSVIAVLAIPPCESALTVMVGNPLKAGVKVIV